MSKKYYWMKLRKDFFQSTFIRILEQKENPDSLIIAYLKLLLSVIDTEGRLVFKHLADNVVEETALTLQVEHDTIKTVWELLEKGKMIEVSQSSNDEYVIKPVLELTGSESDSAERVRKHRALHCNADVTECNAEKKRDIEDNTTEDDKTAEKAAALYNLDSLIAEYGEELANDYVRKAEKWYNDKGKPLPENIYDTARSWLIKDGIQKQNNDIEKYNVVINKF